MLESIKHYLSDQETNSSNVHGFWTDPYAQYTSRPSRPSLGNKKRLSFSLARHGTAKMVLLMVLLMFEILRSF